ncbi:hypothetical protein ABEB36_013855 [Hypothenemus hampei]|uniref:Uncharacterized protein n=1 Tax=Hypothenemus hampei TaxID=57062 RepID=A0ABD1E5Q0_HYPHA
MAFNSRCHNMEVKELPTIHATNSDWNLYIQNALFKEEKSAGELYSENGIDFEVTELQQQRYIRFLSQIPEIFSKLQCWPKLNQKVTILTVTTRLSQNENNFIAINATGTYNSLIEMCKVSLSNEEIKVLYLELLSTLFEHKSGRKWSLNNGYWMEIYNLVAECHTLNNKLSRKLYYFLAVFLRKTHRTAPTVSQRVIEQMTQTINKFYAKSEKARTKIDLWDYKRLPQSLNCLVKVLERLLAINPLPDVLKSFLPFKEAIDYIALVTNDQEVSLMADEILIILSFYQITELFDGIKVINHNPITLSGFFKIIEREYKKNNLEITFELYYQVQKYWKNVSRSMPRYFTKGKPMDIEDELICFQVEPLTIIAEKLLGVVRSNKEEIRKCYLADLLNGCTADGLSLGYLMRKTLRMVPLDVDIEALKWLVKSKPLYNRRNLATVFQTITFSLIDFTAYVKLKQSKRLKNDEKFAEALLATILAYLENFDLSWRESIGSVQLLNWVYELLCNTTHFNAKVHIKALQTLNITISKHMCPNMALLVDCTQNSSLNDLGALLWNKCFNKDAEVRTATLTVVQTMCQKMIQGFESFQKILHEHINQSFVMNMAMNDDNLLVRATSVKCLQEMVLIEHFLDDGKAGWFITNVLQLMCEESETVVLKEIIILITRSYDKLRNSVDRVKIYDVMVKAALNHNVDWEIREQSIKFWDKVMSICLERQGMSDGNFPSVIFSKEDRKIIHLDDHEIRKRLIHALESMSQTGCFKVLQGVLQHNNSSKEVNTYTISIITKLLTLLQRYEVTPEFILFNQAYPNLWSFPSQICASPSLGNEEILWEQIIEDTVMEMFSSCSNRCSSPGNCKKIDQGCNNMEIKEVSDFTVSTVDFIDFIYKKLPYLSKV